MPNSNFGKTFFRDVAKKAGHQHIDDTRGKGKMNEGGHAGNSAVDADDAKDDSEDEVEDGFHMHLIFLVTLYYLQILCQTKLFLTLFVKNPYVVVG